MLLLAFAGISRAVDVPALSPDGGTFTTFQTITVSGQAAAVLRYTTNGLAPTEYDPVVPVLPGGQIQGVQVREPLTLKVTAFANGVGSIPKSADYVITGQVSTSGYHTLVLRADGTVWASGSNSYGQLGDGTTTSRTTFVQLPGLSDQAVAVAAGIYHSLAVKKDGTVWSWGSNSNYQCGNSGGPNPQQVSGLTNVKAIGVGYVHSVALTTSGAVRSWGGGSSYQHGNGSTSNQYTPVTVFASGVKAIAVGASHTMALMTDGSVRCWGGNADGQCGYSPGAVLYSPVVVYGVIGVTAIAAGWDHSVAVKANGTVYGWGSNASYQIGTQPSPTYPALIPNLNGIDPLDSVAAGYRFTLARKADGSVVGLGSNLSGQLGNGSGASSSMPVPLTALGAGRLLAAGWNTCLATKSSGTLWGWGDNSNGALGLGTGATQKNVPIQLLAETFPDAASVTTGATHNLLLPGGTVALPNESKVWAWGGNASGQLGLGNTTTRYAPEIVTNLAAANAPAIASAAGLGFSLVVRPNGTVAAAGDNAFGQLGINTAGAARPSFQAVNALANVGAVAAGRWHAIAIAGATGQVYTWGKGSSGQLGHNAITHRYEPFPINGFTNVAAVAAGSDHSLALKTDGSVWAWGSSAKGQLGNGSTATRTSPAAVGLAGTPFFGVAIAAGLNHSLAVKTNGEVVAWGENVSGQLGNNTQTNNPLPVSVKSPTNVNITNVKMVAAGYAHSLALKHDGTVWAWGRNTEGQLGDGTVTLRKTPVQVLGLSGIVAIAAGDYHNLARKADGTVVSWGSNTSGQLGLGLSTANFVPRVVTGMNVLHPAPGVTITAPASNATFAVDEQFTLEVAPVAASGRYVAKVAYLYEGIDLASAGEAPFSLTLELDTWGDFSITAVAYDDDGTPSFPSPPIMIRIPPPITLSALPGADMAIRLSWNSVLNASTSFQVERRIDGQSVSVIASGVSASGSYRDSNGILFNTTYRYRIRGSSGGSTTALSREVSAVLVDSEGGGGDGLLDSWEILYFGSITASNGGPGQDFDVDGVSDLLEAQANTNPAIPKPMLTITHPSTAVLIP